MLEIELVYMESYQNATDSCWRSAKKQARKKPNQATLKTIYISIEWKML